MKRRLAQKLKDDLPGAFLLITAAVVGGFLINALRAEPLPLAHASRGERLDAAVARLQGAGPAGAAAPVSEFATAGEVEAALGSARVVLVDVRPDLFYDEGRIPGAINLPRDKFEALYPRHAAAMRAAKRVIVYCAGAHCDEAESLTAALRKLGHGNLSVYKGGWAEWTAQNRKVEKEESK